MSDVPFKRQHPLQCPGCLLPLTYKGLNVWECTNQLCEIIELHISGEPQKIEVKKAAVL